MLEVLTPTPPPSSSGGLLEEGAYPLDRPLLRGRMIEETIRYKAPKKVLMTTPTPPIDPAEQLLPQSYRSALSQLRSGHCSRLQSYRHSLGWVDDPSCHECRSTDHTVAHLFSCPTYPTDLALGDMWTSLLQIAQFLAGLPQFSDLPPLQIDFDELPS